MQVSAKVCVRETSSFRQIRTPQRRARVRGAGRGEATAVTHSKPTVGAKSSERGPGAVEDQASRRPTWAGPRLAATTALPPSTAALFGQQLAAGGSGAGCGVTA